MLGNVVMPTIGLLLAQTPILDEGLGRAVLGQHAHLVLFHAEDEARRGDEQVYLVHE